MRQEYIFKMREACIHCGSKIKNISFHQDLLNSTALNLQCVDKPGHYEGRFYALVKGWVASTEIFHFIKEDIKYQIVINYATKSIECFRVSEYLKIPLKLHRNRLMNNDQLKDLSNKFDKLYGMV